MSDYIKNLEFCFQHDQRDRFVTGELRRAWAKRYPELFDERDVEISENRPDRHFYEWLAAILIFESTGYHSLIEKYWCDKHARKFSIYEEIAPSSVRDLEDGYGWPDLFCYNVERTNWYFCEVKGHRDSLKDAQLQLFPKLYKITGKPVLVLNLRTFEL
jgi:hypothetical protein